MTEVQRVRENQAADPAPESSLNVEALELLGLRLASGQGNLSLSTERWPFVPMNSPPATFSDRFQPVNPGVFARPEPPALCPQSPAYNAFIDKSLRNLYDPAPLKAIPDLKTRYNCVIKNDADAMRYANEILKVTQDPFNVVVEPVATQVADRNRRGKQVDIGVDFLRVGPYVLIDKVVPNSSAASAGLKEGDILTHIRGRDVSRLTEEQIRSEIAGSPGSALDIKVLRGSKPAEVRVPVVEKEIPSVRDRMLPGNVLYLRMDNLSSENQPEALRAAILRNPQAESYLIDLRDNPGGLLNNGLRMASIFLDKGKLLTISQRLDSDPDNPQYRRSNYMLTADGIHAQNAANPNLQPESSMARLKQVPSKPLAILVNGGTASAAEIFAVALKENNAATLIGSTTFGKGIGQSIFHAMPGGSSLKLTTFHFYSPDGKWLGDGNSRHNGIRPNVVADKKPIASTFGTAIDDQMNVAREYLANAKRK